MNMSFSKLRKVLCWILDELESDGAEGFDVPEDYYWNVPASYKYKVECGLDTSNLTMGDLEEDLDFLNSMMKGNREPGKYDLVYLGKILQACGERGDLVFLGSEEK